MRRFRRITTLAAFCLIAGSVYGQAPQSYDFIIEHTSSFSQTYWVFGAVLQSSNISHPAAAVDSWHESYNVSDAVTFGAAGHSAMSFAFANGEIGVSSSQEISWPSQHVAGSVVGCGCDSLNQAISGWVYVRGKPGTVVDVVVQGESGGLGGGWAASMFFPAEHQYYGWGSGIGGSFYTSVTRLSGASKFFGGVEYSVLSSFEVAANAGGIAAPLFHSNYGKIHVKLQRKDPPSKLCVYALKNILTATPPSGQQVSLPGHAYLGVIPGVGPDAGVEKLYGFVPVDAANPLFGPLAPLGSLIINAGRVRKEAPGRFHCRVCFDVDTDSYTKIVKYIKLVEENMGSTLNGYNLIGGNCVSFVRGAAGVAGLVLPAATLLGVDDPTALAEALGALPGSFCQSPSPVFSEYFNSAIPTVTNLLHGLIDPVAAGIVYGYSPYMGLFSAANVATGDEVRLNVVPSANALGATVISWGDGSVSGIEPPFAHTYTSPGVFSARVLTTDVGGFHVFDGIIVVSNASPTGIPTDVQVAVAQTAPVPYFAQPNPPESVSGVSNVEAVGGGCAVSGPLIPVLGASLPILGTKMALTVDAGQAAIGVVFVGNVGVKTSLGQLGIGCETVLEAGSLAQLASFTTDSSGRWQVQIHLPNSPTLVGAQFGLQAFAYSGPNSNGITQTLLLSLGFL